MKKKSILILIDAFTRGGAQKVLQTLIPEWIDSGIDVHLVLIQSSKFEFNLDSNLNLGLKLHRINARNMFDFIGFFKLVYLIYRLKPIIVQSHLFWSQIWSGLARLFIGKTYLIWSEHNTYLNRSKLQWFMYKALSRYTDSLVCVSVEVKNYLASMGIDRTIVVTNPISNAFDSGKRLSRMKNVIFVGRLNDQKNPFLAVDSFIYAIEAGLITPENSMYMAGEGPHKRKLMEYVTGLGYEKKIFFLGFLEEKELIDIMADCAVLISTSIFEGYALVRVEALAMGCTLVTTNTAGIDGILTMSKGNSDVIDGVFVSEPNKIDFANSLRQAMSSNLWTDLAIEERVSATSKFKPERIAEAYLFGQFDQ